MYNRMYNAAIRALCIGRHLCSAIVSETVLFPYAAHASELEYVELVLEE